MKRRFKHRWRPGKCLVLAGLAAGLAAGGEARATLILENLPGDETGMAISAGYYHTTGAVGFTPLQDYRLASVTLWLSGYNEAQDAPVIGIWSDAESFGSGMHQPGNPLAGGIGFASGPVSIATPPANDGSLSPFYFNLAAPLDLRANTSYWLVLSSAGPYLYPQSGHFYWAGGSTPAGDSIYNGCRILYSGSYQSWGAAPAFRLETTAVPEPATWLAGALLLGPIAWQIIRHIRSRKKIAA